MYDPALRWPVLALLEKWGRLPLSDLLNMLSPLQRPRFRPDLVMDLEWEGLIRVRRVGDEDVLEITPRGRARLSGQRPTSPPAAAELDQ
jgi:hypothetical protein